MAKHRRRTYLIKTGLQLRYMGIIVTTMFFVAVFVGWIIYHTSWSSISNTPDLSIDKLADIFDYVNKLLIQWIVLIIILIALISIFVSHKIAGPVYHLEKTAQIIASGDLTQIVKLRHGDELIDLQNVFNTMTESLRKMVAKDREVIGKLISMGNQISETMNKKKLDPSELQAVAKDLYLVIEELRQVTAGFKIDKDLQTTNGSEKEAS